MLPAATYTIRLATPDDDVMLRRLAQVDDHRATGTQRVLVGELDAV